MRAYNRFRTDEIVHCEVAGRSEPAALYNLSCGGCMIECASPCIAQGANVAVALNENVSLPGRVVWRIGKNAGIKFDHPLHQAVVERFGYVEEEEFDRNDPRDRFGIPLVGMLHAAAGRLDC